jgi:hypothetical protein
MWADVTNSQSRNGCTVSKHGVLFVIVKGVVEIEAHHLYHYHDQVYLSLIFQLDSLHLRKIELENW